MASTQAPSAPIAYPIIFAIGGSSERRRAIATVFARQ
jgi:hypothetical protein